MYLDAAKKQEIFGKYGKSNTDTGSVESQVALFSYRIARLTEHMKLNRKDYSTERALTMLVGYLRQKKLKERGNFGRGFPALLLCCPDQSLPFVSNRQYLNFQESQATLRDLLKVKRFVYSTDQAS